MANDGSGIVGGALSGSSASLFDTATVRTFAVACLAVAGVALSLRAITSSNTPPKVPDKDENQSKSRNGENKREKTLPSARIDHSSSYDYPAPSHSSGNVPHERRPRRMSSGTSSMWGAPQLYSQSNRGSLGTGNGTKNIVAIFWDVDNCTPNAGATGHEVAQAIRRAAQSIGPETNQLGSIVSFKAYLELSSETATPNAAQVQLRSELQGSGVSLIDTPKSGRKDVADKMMIADLLSFAIDKRPPALIVLLSGDRDFAYPLGILRNRGYEILLITPPTGATPILEASANYKLRWRQDVLGLEYDAAGRPYDKSAARAPNAAANDVNVPAPPSAADTHKSAQPAGPVPDSVKIKAEKEAVPPVFEPLVNVLKQIKEEGVSQPLRSRVSLQLQKAYPNVFAKAQASGWGEFVAVAEAAGIVRLGPGPFLGREWVALPDKPSDDEKSSERTILKRPPTGETVDSTATWSATSEKGLVAFYPLIEAHKSLKSSNNGKDPSSRDVHQMLDEMISQKLADPYTLSKASSFDHYIKLAFRAKVARLTNDGTTSHLVQLNPKYESMYTGIKTPSNASTRLVDTANVAAPTEPKQNRFAALFSSDMKRDLSDQGNSNAPPIAIKKSAIPTQPQAQAQLQAQAQASGYPFPPEKSFAHQPSGEVILVSYFPLVNLLLTKRSEGEYATREAQIHKKLSTHHKLGKYVSNWDAFQAYLHRAKADDVVSVIESFDERFVQVSERLCKGEGDDKHKGFVRGQHSNLRTERAASSSSSGSPKNHAEQVSNNDGTGASNGNNRNEQSSTPTPSPPMVASSPFSAATLAPAKEPRKQFNTEQVTPNDRQKFKSLIDALVMLRRRDMARALAIGITDAERQTREVTALEPLRNAVASTLVRTTSSANDKRQKADGSVPEAAIMVPGIWLQMHGYASFTDFFNEAERKGFVHLISREGRERVRLAKRYEDMFFAVAT